MSEGDITQVLHLILSKAALTIDIIENCITNSNLNYALVLPVLVLLTELLDDSCILQVVLIVNLATILHCTVQSEICKLIPACCKLLLRVLVAVSLHELDDVLLLLDNHSCTILEVVLELNWG